MIFVWKGERYLDRKKLERGEDLVRSEGDFSELDLKLEICCELICR